MSGGSDLKMCLSGRNDAPIVVRVAKSSKLLLIDFQRRVKSKVGNKLVAF